jgi:hypothetical protein
MKNFQFESSKRILNEAKKFIIHNRAWNRYLKVGDEIIQGKRYIDEEI